MSDTLDLAAIKTRAEAATPGPWHVEESRWDIPDAAEVDRIVCGPRPSAGPPRDGIADVFDGHWVEGVEEPGPAPNLMHIAGMDPTTTLALVAEVERLQAAISEAVGWIDSADDVPAKFAIARNGLRAALSGAES